MVAAPAAASPEPTVDLPEPEPVVESTPELVEAKTAVIEPVEAPAAATEPLIEPVVEPVAAPVAVAPVAVTEPADVEPVSAPVAAVEAAAAEPVIFEPPAGIEEPDDLTKIAGIGPKMAMALAAAGITTYAKLADADVISLKQAVTAAGMRGSASLATWPERARELVGVKS
ncbi:helix-hairpin-helix domain-containing protein [Actinoplanes sp. NPDC024001]|uniref:helix-hairpin-helix domain-containing protein n=1 Tax=Actinoplanes sp. NPDC024001 TaxID=3154598 RepID=UPI0034091539